MWAISVVILIFAVSLGACILLKAGDFKKESDFEDTKYFNMSEVFDIIYSDTSSHPRERTDLKLTIRVTKSFWTQDEACVVIHRASIQNNRTGSTEVRIIFVLKRKTDPPTPDYISKQENDVYQAINKYLATLDAEAKKSTIPKNLKLKIMSNTTSREYSVWIEAGSYYVFQGFEALMIQYAQFNETDMNAVWNYLKTIFP